MEEIIQGERDMKNQNFAEEKYRGGDVTTGIKGEPRQKIIKLCNKIQNLTKVKPGDPEYNALACCVSDEMADVAMVMGVRKKKTATEIAQRCKKQLEETQRLLDQLADIGVCMVDDITGENKYWIPIFVPGIMEMLVGNKALVEAHPEIAVAFSEYTIKRIIPLAGNLPVGGGVMRIIPIEKAIDGETRRASFEELSHYIEENDDISVADCSCRRSRRLMGEGCGHLEKDMCIQLGDAARYYIKSGRGRRITKDEAYDILRRAEENGLMHQIPNTDGSGHTHAICNCCGCSCFSLRTVEYFHTPGMIRSNYVAKVDSEKCVACGECVAHCPVNALRLGEKLCTAKPIAVPEKITADDHEWGPDKWNPDYRFNRENVVTETGTSPCKTACPAHIGIQGYIKLASLGRYKDAFELIKINNPFPAVCGRICSKDCEQACTRGDIDEPLAIDEIKKFIADQEMKEKHRFVPKKRHDYGNRIAIVGAGPAGLSCAYYLAIGGYDVTVFEKQDILGGMLTFGIPSFRLEKNVINAEIDILRELGVNFRTGVEVGKDVTLDELRKEGFEGFYLAIGAQAGRKLGIEGEESEGVITGVDFLRNVNTGKKVELNGKVVVIGGGNVAVDVARTAMRVNTGSVEMYCLESREEMPAAKDEIAETLAEKIGINNGWGPAKILTENGKVTGVEFKKCVSVFDREGRFSPVYDDNERMKVECSYVLSSIGQSVVWGNILDGSKVVLNRNRTAQADSLTYQTAEPDIFVGGDVYTGPKFAIDAIAAGKEAAISLHRFVHPGQSLRIGRDRREYKEIDKTNIVVEDYDHTPRQRAGHIALDDAFRDVRRTFTDEQIKKETQRCLGCGVTVVDTTMCVGCGQCTTRCKFDAIKLEKVFDEHGVVYEKVALKAIPHVIKRKAKILVTSAKEKLAGKKA
jgi:NADPH-dependent glutamate synthase beta subunit-like oxidoreductase/NAD-dependent dihydropyrimidine dehydrogenase PreA subunit